MINIRFKTAFTLVELLVVIAIIGILSGLIIVGMNSSVNNARIAKAQIFSASLRDSLLGNIISEWKFDDLSTALNNQSIQDSWSSGNNCTLYTGTGDAADKLRTDCVYGKCVYLDGVDDYLDCGNKTVWDMTSKSHTIEIWIKTSGIIDAGAHIINRFTGGTPGNGYVVYMNKSNGYTNFEERADGGNGLGLSSNKSLADNNWHHVVATVDVSTKSGIFYVDGVQSGTDTYLGNLINYNVALRLGTGGTGYSFLGSIDGVRIYDTVIPTSLIKQKYYIGLNNILIKDEIKMGDYQKRLAEVINNFAKNEIE